MADGAADLLQMFPLASAPQEELERDCLETAREAIRSPRLYPSLTGTTRQIANDYRNRALFELVQNAHDALVGEGQDEIRIMYRRTKDGAVLMVANRGIGFDADNVEGVRLPSRSTKKYGEGIGNKGLGLRSLASLTQVPEIYSCLGEGRSRDWFDGYCFRFADDAAAKAIFLAAGADESRMDWLLRHVPRSLLTVPIPVREQPDDVRNLAKAGFATVVRIVLTSPAAMTDVEAQIAEFTDGDAPPTLFLDRIGALSVEVHGSSHRTTRIVRRSTPLFDVDGPIPFSVAKTRIDGTDFLIVSRPLSRDAFEEAVRKSIEHDPKLEEWLDAPADTIVSLAVPLGHVEGRPGRTYCYLPLGKAVPSPFLGHMHAPFLASLNRKEMDPKAPLNAFLLQACAGAALASARHLAAGAADGLGIDRRAVADLVAWGSTYVKYLTLANGGKPPTVDAFLPIAGGGWTSFQAARRWETSKDGLSGRTLALDAAAPILEPRLGKVRLDKLAEARGSMWLNASMNPKSAEVAGWIETLAAVKASQRDPWKTWGRFLDAVVKSFIEQDFDLAELSGLEILFGGPSEAKPALLAAQSNIDNPVYLADRSARRGRKREARMPPRSLGRRVNLVDARVAMSSATKEALLGAKLVSEVDPLRILKDHRRIVSANPKPETLSGILTWAFDVWEALKDDAAKVLKDSHIRVPTRAGRWIDAADALLSSSWSDEGRRLETVTRELTEKSSDAKALEAAFIADPGTGPFPADEQARNEWTKFLMACGVRDGIRPVPSKSKLEGQAHKFWRWYLEGKSAGAPTDPHWLAAVAGTTFAFPQSHYVGKDPAGLGFCRLPYQAEHTSLSPEGKIEYAMLILAMLGDAQKGFLQVKVVNEPKGDPKELPSPARSFLSNAAWMPVAEGNGIGFAAPPLIWWRRTRGREIPRSIRRPHEEVRSRLVEDKVWNRVAELGIGDWSLPQTAASRLASLAEAVQAGVGTADEKAAFRVGAAQAWQDLVQTAAKLPQGATFPVGVGEGFDVLHAGGAFDGRIYVASDISTMEARILQERGTYMIEGTSNPREVAAILKQSGVPAAPLADLAVRMLADGLDFTPSGSSPKLVASGREWLVDLAVLALDVEGRMLAYQVSRPNFRSTLDKVRLHFCSKLAVVVDDGPPSEMFERFVHLDDKENPTLLAVGSPELRWDDMKPLARALERLVDGRADGALRLAFAAVGAAFAGTPFEKPSNEAIAEVLRCPVWRVDQSFGRDFGGLDYIRNVVAPVVAALFGHELGTALLADLEQSDGEFDLSGWFRRAKVQPPLTVEDFVGACREAEDRDALRRRFGLSLVEYNAAIAVLGQEPLESRANLRGQFEFHRRATRERVIDRLRHHHRSDFAAGQSLADYAMMRKMPFLIFDEAWLRSMEAIDAGVVEGMARTALDAKYGSVVPEVALEPFAEVHAKNEALAVSAVRKTIPVVVAWCRVKHVPVPEIWKQAPVDVVRHLDAAGTLDFIVLDDASVHIAYALAGTWPANMPASSDPAVLGLGASQVEDAKSWRTEENRKREEERRRFSFGGKDYDGGTKSDLAAMVAAARSQADADTGWEARCRRASLVAVEKAQKRPGGGGGGGGNGKPGLVVAERRMSEAKRNAVGLLGEVRAFDWIMLKHGLTREQTEEAWCSPNRTITSLGKTGDDTLGYDFEVIKENGTRWRYEVKASQYDPEEFELGSSEVKAALEAASDRNMKYRILYVPEVATAGRWRVIELPNPLAPSKRSLFQELGRSALGFGFTEKS